MNNLFRVLRNHLDGLMLGNIGNGGRILQSGRFHTCPEDKTPETIPLNDCERAFEINFTGLSELEGWNSLNIDATYRVRYNVTISYMYTKAGIYEEGFEGFSQMQGNADNNAVNDRALTDAAEVIKTMTYHENFGILQASPLVDVFSLHPLNQNELNFFKDRAILNIGMEAYVKVATTSDYSGT